MVFYNGLKGAENAVISYLIEEADLSQRISLKEIADATYYSYDAVQRAAKRLELDGLIRRKDTHPGLPHRFEVNGQ